MSVNKTHLKGLLAAPLTPFDVDGNVDLDGVDKLANHLKSTGVVGVFISGTTGEGPSLSVEERESLTVQWVKHQTDTFSVLVNLPHYSLPDARRLARHAQEHGARGIALLPPSYYKPTLQTLASFCQQVASSAPRLPFYYYHIPGMTGVSFKMQSLLSTLEQSVPTLSGVKYSSPDLSDYLNARLYGEGKYNILYGADQQILGALATGATGFVGSTYNVCGKLYTKLIAAFEEGNLQQARELQALSVRFVDVCDANGFPAAIRAALAATAGIDLGSPRLPITATCDTAAVVKALTDAGVLKELS